MHIIARKSIAVAVLYLFILLMGVGLIILGAIVEEYSLLGLGGISLAVAVIILIHYLIKPNIAVAKDKEGNYHIGKHIMSLDDIRDVKYKCATARGLTYNWGKLYVSTIKGEYAFSYISNVEDCSRLILDVVIANKSKKLMHAKELKEEKKIKELKRIDIFSNVSE